MHLFKCFVKFFKGSYKICLSIYHFEIMKIQKVCISNLSTVAAIKLSQHLSGLDFCNKNFVLFVEKIMGQIQLNTSNGINVIAIIWVLQAKWINPKFQTFYARYNRCLGWLKTGYSLLLLASSTMSFYKSSVTFFSSQWRTDFTYTLVFHCWVLKIWKENFVFFCGL